MGYSNWGMVKKVKETVNIPVVSNGGIKSYLDVQTCLNYTKADGVMVSEGILQNPAIFANQIHSMEKMALEYLSYALKYNAALP